MVRSPEPSSVPNLAEVRRRLQVQRRRLDRLAVRYQQLDQALQSLEMLVDQYAPPAAEPDDARPRKPR